MAQLAKYGTMMRIDRDTLAALHELRWRYRAVTLSDVVAAMVNDVDPEVYREYISEDEPEE